MSDDAVSVFAHDPRDGPAGEPRWKLRELVDRVIGR
jgi:hypothetical protein